MPNSNSANREALKQIRPYTLQKDLNTPDNSKCAICMKTLAKGDKVRTLPCLHTFHSAEIKKWLKIDKKCPFCKTSTDF